MDAKLEKALDNLHKRLKTRKPTGQHINKQADPLVDQSTSQQEIIRVEREESLFRANCPRPSPRDQQDLMSFPFFSLSKTKRTKPIIYEQGDVKVFIEGLPSVGIATIWDADFLIWVASQLNAWCELIR